jgi:hypothetical protein
MQVPRCKPNTWGVTHIAGMEQQMSLSYVVSTLVFYFTVFLSKV